MPHIVFDKMIDLTVFSEKFKEIFQKESMLIKVQNIFTDRHKRLALLPAVVIDSKNQNFLIEINVKEEKTTVRLYPRTDPEKTDGVLAALIMVGKLIMVIFPDVRITKTNIEKMKEVN
jgi:hypothetical protein